MSSHILIEKYLGLAQEGVELTEFMLHSQIARLEYRLRTLVQQVREQRFGDETERRRTEQRLLDYETITMRRTEADAPSTLALDLQSRLLEQEKELVTGDTPTSDNKDEQIYSVLPFDVSDMPAGDHVDESEDEDPEDQASDAAASGRIIGSSLGTRPLVSDGESGHLRKDRRPS